jgi:putative transposase
VSQVPNPEVGRADESGAEVIELEVMPRIKGRSSRLLRDEFRWLRSRLPTLWINSYFVATAGSAQLAVIKQCIEQQKPV